MPDREKVIKEKLDEMVELTRGLSYAGFMTAVENANDILALLKEQEDVNNALVDQCDRIRKLVIELAEQPQIVRCKDCKHGVPSSDEYMLCNKGIKFDQYKKPDWFCADGEKRT